MHGSNWVKTTWTCLPFFGSLWIFLDKQTYSCDVGIECCPLKAKLFFFFANLWSSNSDNHYFAHFPHKFPPFSYNVTAKECFVILKWLSTCSRRHVVSFKIIFHIHSCENFVVLIHLYSFKELSIFFVFVSVS